MTAPAPATTAQVAARIGISPVKLKSWVAEKKGAAWAPRPWAWTPEVVAAAIRAFAGDLPAPGEHVGPIRRAATVMSWGQYPGGRHTASNRQIIIAVDGADGVTRLPVRDSTLWARGMVLEVEATPGGWRLVGLGPRGRWDPRFRPPGPERETEADKRAAREAGR